MYAIRQIQQVVDGKVVVQLPDDFSATQVEVIVLPVEPTNGSLQKASRQQSDDEGIESIQRILNMDITHLSEQELKAYQRTSDILRKWLTTRESPVLGAFAGLIHIAEDFDAPLPDEILELFYGSETDEYDMSLLS